MRALSDPKLREKWLNASVVVTAAVLALDVVYLYFLKFKDFVHSDAATTVVMANGALARGLPVDVDWYFANGDVWLFAPHLYAMPLVAIWGISVETLRAAEIFGYAVEVTALLWAYKRLGGELRGAVLGTALMLLAWSRLHVLFVYIELSYGFVATLYLTLFAVHSLLFDRPSRKLWIGCALFTFVASAQNPTRGVVFAVAPLVAACVWPWRGSARRTRAITAAAPIAGLFGAVVFQKLVLQRYLTFSTPSGHLEFKVKDAAGIARNAANMARGVVGLAGDMSSIGVTSAFGLALLVLALVLVVRHAFGREATPLRFVCIAALAQTSAVGGPMLIGNLVINPVSIRYLIPSLLTIMGLGAVIAMRLAKEHERTALAFCAIAPMAALLTLLRIVGSYALSGESTTGQFAHSASHQNLADELTARGLRHGFATYWNAHLLTLLSRGSAKTCPVNFANVVIPYRWNTDTWCYDPARLTDRFFVVTTADERATARTSIQTTLGTPAEQFSVGNEFDVSVFRTADVPPRWLASPIPDGPKLNLPLRIEATHPQIRFGDQSAIEGGKLVANGKEGVISFGPYVELPAGDYRVRWFGTPLGDDGELGFDVYPSGAPSQIAERSVRVADLPRDGRPAVELTFTLPKRAAGVELRTYSRGGAKIALEAVELSR